MADEIKPSNMPQCQFPILCDKSGQCEFWLRKNIGCQAACLAGEVDPRILATA